MKPMKKVVIPRNRIFLDNPEKIVKNLFNKKVKRKKLNLNLEEKHE